MEVENTKSQRILIIEDEPDMALGLRDNFEYHGYAVSVARDGEEGLNQALAEQPDLIILDVMMPRMNGLDVCRQLRGRNVAVPIIMLTARGQEMDKVIGLETGADDYVTKPFSPQELVARVRAHLRRQARRSIETYHFGGIDLDFKRYQASKDGHPLDLSPREYEILKYLVERHGETVTREQLLDEVWGYDNYPLTRTIDNHIAKLRHKIEPAPAEPRYIITVHRIGYRFLG
ncbi:MAG: response regulator transcription factor [Blastocatellia bacterium]